MSDVTFLRDAAAAGDRKAAVDLRPLVYDELRKLAAARMADESPGHTLPNAPRATQCCTSAPSERHAENAHGCRP
jgi:hypothetical protein